VAALPPAALPAAPDMLDVPATAPAPEVFCDPLPVSSEQPTATVKLAMTPSERNLAVNQRLVRTLRVVATTAALAEEA
jgi:hypothetical protein